jgi:hypothetical protein
VSTPVRASTGRCARDPASLPQGSLAPVRVLLSRSLIAYYDPIRQSRRHAATSRPCRLYAAPSLCGSAEAACKTFPTFAAVLSTRAADPTPVGPTRRSRCVRASGARLPRTINESPPTSTRLCQQCSTGLCISVLHRSRHATARVFARPSWLATTKWSHMLSAPPRAAPRSRRGRRVIWLLDTKGSRGRHVDFTASTGCAFHTMLGVSFATMIVPAAASPAVPAVSFARTNASLAEDTRAADATIVDPAWPWSRLWGLSPSSVRARSGSFSVPRGLVEVPGKAPLRVHPPWPRR